MCRVWGWGLGSQTRLINIFILEVLRKFKINNEECTSFKIERIKLLLTMPHRRDELLRQIPHPGEDNAVKCPTNARGGMRALGIDGAKTVHRLQSLILAFNSSASCSTCRGDISPCKRSYGSLFCSLSDGRNISPPYFRSYVQAAWLFVRSRSAAFRSFSGVPVVGLSAWNLVFRFLIFTRFSKQKQTGIPLPLR